MRGNIRKLALPFAALVVLVAASTAGGASQASDTLVFAGAADPTYLDPALVSDGESFRVTEQIFQSLVELKPGTTTIRPALATKWTSKNAKDWTFTLRKGVKFHDGTPFNAAAVCYNFNRQYNFTGAFQDAVGDVLLADRVRRLPAQRERRSLAEPVRRLHGARQVLGDDPPPHAVRAVPARTGDLVVRDPEPDRAEEVRREPGRASKRRVLSDGLVRLQPPDRDRPVQVRVVDGGREGRAHAEQRRTGARSRGSRR